MRTVHKLQPLDGPLISNRLGSSDTNGMAVDEMVFSLDGVEEVVGGRQDQDVPSAIKRLEWLLAPPEGMVGRLFNDSSQPWAGR
jgi:hypothetical protein